MINCLEKFENLKFSSEKAKKRIETSVDSMGESVVKNLLSFTLFLMGGKREDIAHCLSIPMGTFLSLLTRIGRFGLPAIEDRRKKASEFLPHDQGNFKNAKVEIVKDQVILNLGMGDKVIQMPARNALQVKTVLLTMLQNGLLSLTSVAQILGYTLTHTNRLCRQLNDEDIPALLDKRQGQKHDYQVTPEVKAEIIQQYVARIVTGRSASSDGITEVVNEQTQKELSPRTVRWHIQKLGLQSIKKTLPKLLDALKKNS